MASTVTIRVQKLDDLTLVQICKDVLQILAGKNPICILNLAPGIGTDINEIADLNGFAGRYAFQSASIRANIKQDVRFSLSFYREVKTKDTREPSARYDEFDFSFGTNENNWSEYRELAASLLGTVSRFDVPKNLTGAPDDDGSETLRELLVSFSAVQRNMLETLNYSVAEIEKKRAELELDFHEKEKERALAHQVALDKIAQERDELSLQSHMSERRALMRQMTDNTAAEARKSMAPRGAIYSRWGVFFVAITLAVMAGYLSLASIVQLGVSEELVAKLQEFVVEGGDREAIKGIINQSLGPTNWYLIGRGILSSLAALGALVYAAAWLRGFYNAEMSAAREIDRFNYDLTRASWIIETVLEVQHEKKGTVPEAWINGVTKNLFEGSSVVTPEDQGTKALRALLGYSAAASFGPDGPKFELKQRNARKLAKDADT
ncbi:MAG: hypothetical protein AAGE61_12785 [Pseudomonadota bacterium]